MAEVHTAEAGTAAEDTKVGSSAVVGVVHRSLGWLVASIGFVVVGGPLVTLVLVVEHTCQEVLASVVVASLVVHLLVASLEELLLVELPYMEHLLVVRPLVAEASQRWC